MLTSVAAELRHVSRRVGDFHRVLIIGLVLFAAVLSATTALAQATGQQPQPAPPIAGSPQHQMTQGSGPSPQITRRRAEVRMEMSAKACSKRPRFFSRRNGEKLPIIHSWSDR